MKRSSSDNPPRVGMVVRFARSRTGNDVPDGAQFTVGDEGNLPLPSVWNRGQYDIISESTTIPVAGPFAPSTRGNQVNIGISPRDLYAKAFGAGWNAANDRVNPLMLTDALADALNKEGLL